MVDILTEENRVLRQEMDVCREKITKLHKVISAAERLLCIDSISIVNSIYMTTKGFLENEE